MNKIQVYTSSSCPFCARTKLLLDNKGVEYQEIPLDDNPEKKLEVMKELNWKTVPIIIINDKLIGGYQQLASLESTGELDKLLS